MCHEGRGLPPPSAPLLSPRGWIPDESLRIDFREGRRVGGWGPSVNNSRGGGRWPPRAGGRRWWRPARLPGPRRRVPGAQSERPRPRCPLLLPCLPAARAWGPLPPVSPLPPSAFLSLARSPAESSASAAGDAPPWLFGGCPTCLAQALTPMPPIPSSQPPVARRGEGHA